MKLTFACLLALITKILLVGAQGEPRFTPCPANSAPWFWHPLGKRVEMDLVHSVGGRCLPFMNRMD